VIEGIETEEQKELLKNENILLLAQGYYFSKPLNKMDFEKLYL